MGKYIGSPWGKIRGKVDGSVGGAWKGIDWLRVLVLPISRGSLEKYKDYKAGKIASYSFSYKQMNVRHVVMNSLGYLSRKYYTLLLTPWLDYLTKHPSLKLGPMNAFIKTNVAPFFASFSDSKSKEYDAATNTPTLISLKVSKGDLEPIAAITSATYTAGTGACVVVTTKDIFGNGALTDELYWAVLRKPILASAGVDGTWEPALTLYGMADSTKTRNDEGFTVTLPKGLTAEDMVLYVYCKDAAGTIGYSDSVAIQIAAPA